MKILEVLLLLIPLVACDFDCPQSPVIYQPYSFYQFYSNVGDGFNCNITFSAGNSSSLLSMEMTNIGDFDLITIVSGNTTISSKGQSALSIQQIFRKGDVTISIKAANPSQMRGIYFVSSVGKAVSVPATAVNASYNQEGFILQQFNGSDLNLPRKWVITADSQVALISAINIEYCPLESCAQLIWIYEGIAGDSQGKFIGTAADFQNNLYLSKGKTMTLYLPSISPDSRYNFSSMRVDQMAVIANEFTKCSSYDAVFYGNEVHTNILNATDGTGACLTVLNSCTNAYCSGVYLTGADPADYSASFFVYAGVPHPNPVHSGLVIDNFNPIYYAVLYVPQVFGGNARTFYILNGTANLGFNSADSDFDQYFPYYPFILRQGFLMTDFYPFMSGDMSSNEVYFNPTADYSYNITLMLKNDHSSSESYVTITRNGIKERMYLHTDLPRGVRIDVHVEPNTQLQMSLTVVSQEENMGTYITWRITSAKNVPQTTTSTTGRPTTSRRTTSTTKTTMTTTANPSSPPPKTKITAGVVFWLVTVLSLLISLF